MPRLPVVEPDQAQGDVKAIYERYEKGIGKVPKIIQGMANSPAAVSGYQNLAQALKCGSLSAKDHELVYLTTSEMNHCHYCVSAHSKVAESVGLSRDEILGIRRGEPSDPKQRALVEFTRRVIETKGFVEDADLQKVREAGYSDAEIAEVPGIIALATFSNLFNHINETELDFPEAEPL